MRRGCSAAGMNLTRCVRWQRSSWWRVRAPAPPRRRSWRRPAWAARTRSCAWSTRPTYRRAQSATTSKAGARLPARYRRQLSSTSPLIICMLSKVKRPRAGAPTPLQLARLLRSAAVDKKAWDAVVMDVRDKTSVADYFVVCEGETDRQVRAIADGMVEAAKARQLRPLAVDGYDDASWILLDFDSVLAHVFLPGERSYYDLESLWGRADKRRRKAV